MGGPGIEWALTSEPASPLRSSLQPAYYPGIGRFKSRATEGLNGYLLDFDTSSQILGLFSAGGGRLQFQYDDDALVGQASLRLSAVPEPSTLLTVGLGLIGLAGYAGRMRFRREARPMSGDSAEGIGP